MKRRSGGDLSKNMGCLMRSKEKGIISVYRISIFRILS